MHRPIEDSLEIYLRGDAAPERLSAFHEHLAGCAACRRQVQRMEEQSRMIRTLAPPQTVEPRAGFYARVMESIEARRNSSMWAFFLQPSFSFRLVMASTVLLVLLAASMMSSDPVMELNASSPEAILASEDVAREVGFDQDEDRDAILVNLATFEDALPLE